MARFSKCTDKCASKVLDTADIVRDAIFRQVRLGTRVLPSEIDECNQAMTVENPDAAFRAVHRSGSVYSMACRQPVRMVARGAIRYQRMLRVVSDRILWSPRRARPVPPEGSSSHSSSEAF